MNREERNSDNESLPDNKGFILQQEPQLQPAVLRDARSMARRVLLLAYLNVIAETGEKASVVHYLRSEGLWNELSPGESAIIRRKSISADEKGGLLLGLERAWTLLWALGHVPALDRPVSRCVVRDLLCCLPGFLCPADSFIKAAQLRPPEELLHTADLYYRLHHGLNQSPPSEKQAPGTDPSIIRERHAALQWVLFSDRGWDDFNDNGLCNQI